MTVIQGGKYGTLDQQIAAGKVGPTGQPIVAAPQASSFQGVGSDGNLVNITAPDANTALTAPGLGKTSGVISNPPGLDSPSVTRLTAIDNGGSDGITSSSSSSRTDEQNLGSKITTMSSPTYQSPTNNTSYLDQFDKLYKNLYDSSIDSINQSSDSDIAATQTAQNKETGSVSAQVARLGGYLGDSGSGMGVLNNLATAHRAEIASLESKRQEALQAAREGYATKSFALAQAKVDEADKYEQEAYKRQQDFFTTSQKLINQQNISKAISGGAKTTQQIFDSLGGTVSTDDINDYLKGVTPDDSTSAFKLTSDDTAKLLGSGLSQKDIGTALDYVDTNGYTDTFRAMLTPTERKQFDAIFLPKQQSVQNGRTITSGALVYTPDDFSQDTSLLEQGGTVTNGDGTSSQFLGRGSDGYADPNTFYALFKSWASNGGTIADFLKTYPPADYINPDNDWLPAFLRPKKAAGTNSGFGASDNVGGE